MGTWSASSFGNDTALDFVAKLGSSDGVRQRLSEFANRRRASDVDTESEAIAAADLVATMMGRPPADLPPLNFDDQDVHPGDALMSLARRVVRKIHKQSELRELWLEEDLEAWEAEIQDLLRRLDPKSPHEVRTPANNVQQDILGYCFVCRQSVPEADGITLEWKSDPEGDYSEITVWAHRACIEQVFKGPHWKSDGVISDFVQQQYNQYIENEEDRWW